MIKVCPNTGCGKPVEDVNGKYCPHCGYVLIGILNQTEAERLQAFAEVARGQLPVQPRALPQPSKVEEPEPVLLDPVPEVEVVPPEAPSKPVITEVIDVVPELKPQPKVEPAPLPKAETRKVEVENLFDDVKVEERLSPTAQRLAVLAAAKPNVESVDEPPPRQFELKPMTDVTLAEPLPSSTDLQTVRQPLARRGISPWWGLLVGVIIGLAIMAWLSRDKPFNLTQDVAAAPGSVEKASPTSEALIDELARREAREAKTSAKTAQDATIGLDGRVKRLEDGTDIRPSITGLRLADDKGLCPYDTTGQCILRNKAEGQRLLNAGLITAQQVEDNAREACQAVGCN